MTQLRSNKMKYLLIIIFSFLILIGAFSFLLIKNDILPVPPFNSKSQKSNFVIPDYVNLRLDSHGWVTVEKEPNKPWLNLWVYASNNGCSSATDMKIDKKINVNEMTIDILGYELYEADGNQICPAVMVESRSNIEIGLNWLRGNDKKTVIFNLAGVSNKYVLERQNNIFTLTPISTKNVISSEPGNNTDKKAQKLELAL